MSPLHRAEGDDAPASGTAAPIVSAPAGTIRGLVEGGTAVFRGIPYADPPVGELRWLAPRRRAPFDGVFDATRWGATPQRRPFADVTTIPEPTIPGDDVLTLNVFTAPDRLLAGAEPLPVMVWIHGGGYTAGSAASPWYDGSAFVRDGVVVVTIAYRVAFDGFGWLPGVVADRGLLDWICALEWVRDNIRAFGGDPERVTIAGQSAGGGAVLCLLATEAAQPLFARAMSLSGIDEIITPEHAEQLTRSFAAHLGIEATPDAFGALSDAALQAASAEWRAASGELLLAYAPTTPRLPEGLAVTGLDTPLVLGSTTDEFGAFQVAEGVSATDAMFRSTCVRVARARAGASAGTWLYSFEWVSPVTGGATHCIDLPFVFDVLAESHVAGTLGATPEGLAAVRHADAVAFVRGESPSWAPAVGTLADEVRVYDTVSTVGHGQYATAIALVDAR
ncbi:carboxylesterase/lipase family protein [Galbitalea soli]|uniref:Carboxylic ester hydrolase n=1 Tax=Galbitalea soli TaxID=1268042 RepID=A0A7C9TPU3_9MICO|nr:carboxylesterase family protein [Galbitalea soli]NEM90976.1 carboxylesterase/lipase family protein [Galbitalea soli]NYJ29663.1 para-nitrobenzyl esterase [Galbitalea soli]